MNIEDPAVLEGKRIEFLGSELGLGRDSRILDVGANPIHDAPYKPLLDAGLCHVWGFEPHPGAFQKLQQMKSDRETYFPHAVGDGTPGTLYIYGGSGYTSTFPIREETLKIYGTVGGMTTLKKTLDLETVTLDSLDDLPNVDLVKIDIQGGELAVFQNGRSKMADVSAVVTEVAFIDLYHGEPTLGDVDVELRAQGLILHRFLFQTGKVLDSSQSQRFRAHTPFTKTQILDGDAVYIRDITRPDSISSDQLRNLVLFADSVFKSFDLAVFCMDRLVERGDVDASVPARYFDMLPANVKL
ncbi:MAG: FkbM family methyltransferase [Rhodobacteraceae bacterium]|nr:FkbM family methyltransferase [Paracoccaceae bacterium]